MHPAVAHRIYGPTNQALIARVQGDVQKAQAENPGAKVPIDLVTTSASGWTRTSRRLPPNFRFSA